MKTRIQSLLKTLNEGVYEKETEIGLSLLAALAGQSILLLGPPGVAKSMVARRLKYAFGEARSFEYLMSRFSTPDEIFGPVSIKALKEEDRYERRTSGYLPDADVVFLDEIWKAGPAIQNTLLTVVNEKLYLNGDHTLHLPLKLLIGASNELPTEGEGLEALWDRFILRLVSKPIATEECFYSMIQATTSDSSSVDKNLVISATEYKEWQQQIDAVEVPMPVLRAITAIRQALKDVKIEGQDVHRTLYVSDRRWKHIVRLLKTSAFVHDRTSVALEDLQIAVHALWNEPDELPAVGAIVGNAIFGQYLERLDSLNRQVSRQLRVRQMRDALENARIRGDHRDDDLIVFDGFYYALADATGVQNTFIYVTDFKNLPTRTGDEPAVRGVMYRDPQQPRRSIIRAYSNPDNFGNPDVELTRVNLFRDSMNLYINGVRYALKRAGRGVATEQASGLEPSVGGEQLSLEACEGAVDALFQEATVLNMSIGRHLFASADIQKMISSQMDAFRRQIAQLRADVRKLLYDE